MPTGHIGKRGGFHILQTWLPIAGFHCHAIKKYIQNHLTLEAKNSKCYKRLINKQFLQVSGLYGTPFLSYLPKHSTEIYRAQYTDAKMLVSFPT